MPEPPVCSMVSVYSTMLPHLSATVRFVVFRFSVSGAVFPVRWASVAPTVAVVTSPAATGFWRVLPGLIRQARSAAYRSESSVRSGTSTYAGSPTYLPRSANASALASR